MYILYEVWNEDGTECVHTTASLKEAKIVRDDNPGAYICYEDESGAIIELE